MSRARNIAKQRLAKGEISEIDYKRIIKTISDVDSRKLWEHEDILINQRITWLGVSQGLLLTAYAVILKENTNSSFNDLVNLLPFIGLIVSFFVLLGVVAASSALFIIEERSDDYDVKSLGINCCKSIFT